MLSPSQFLDDLSDQLVAAPESARLGVAGAVDYFSKARLHFGDDWTNVVQKEIAMHPAINHIRLCPLTQRCASKPRGYAGDAVMIDYIYGTGLPATMPSSLIGQAVFAYTTSSPASRSVRYRRYRLADLIDSAAIEPLHRGKQGLECSASLPGMAASLS